jgi:Fe2+ transport system protein FeoA
MNYREFTASVRTARGTEAVTIRARNEDVARQRLLELGYLEVLWIL